MSLKIKCSGYVSHAYSPFKSWKLPYRTTVHWSEDTSWAKFTTSSWQTSVFWVFYNKVSGNLLQALNDHQAVLKSISVSWRSLPLKVRQNAGSGHTGYSRHPACRNPPRTHRKAHLLKKKTTDYCKFEPVIKGKMQRIFCRKNKVNDLLQVNLFPKGFWSSDSCS